MGFRYHIRKPQQRSDQRRKTPHPRMKDQRAICGHVNSYFNVGSKTYSTTQQLRDLASCFWVIIGSGVEWCSGGSRRLLAPAAELGLGEKENDTSRLK